MRKFTKTQRDEWLAELRAELKPRDTLHTVLRHVSASGMSRWIDVYRLNNESVGMSAKRWLSPRVAAITGIPFDERRECLKIDGCGTDVGFEAVYQLGRKLWPGGFPVVGRGRNGDTSGHDQDGGYALKQTWF